MSLRLRALAKRTPERVLAKELSRVDELTTAALDGLLERHAPGALARLGPRPEGSGADLEGRRDSMAAAHEARVKALVDAVGRERAVNLAREELFRVGIRLGEEARARLGVGDALEDLVLAAKVLYRVLGIEFRVEREGSGGAVIRVDRCALAQRYSDDTCLALSATDEGVVNGLNPRVTMVFEERLTAGAPECVARLHIGDVEV
jgi:hypothetical protein